MDVRNQVFFVLGVSKSGSAVAEYVLSKGGKCYVYDRLEEEIVEKNISKLVSNGAIRVKDEKVDEIIDEIDVFVISPGVPINHEIAVKAKRKGKYIIGELEFGFQCCLPSVVAVTGTNGKTTTCSIIQQIFEQCGRKSLLVGNVGQPLTSKIGEVDRNTVCVTEVSSFQLESVNAFAPHVSCVLNIAPDHLERHYTMENYLFLKKRIFRNQREGEYCILNYDDEIVREFHKESRAKTVWVSCKEKVNGAYCLDNNVYYKDTLITSIDKISLKGEHNVYNCLFAIAVAKLYGVSNSDVANALENVKGVKHRIEFVANIQGKNYYNDSKATNVASTLTAIKSMENSTVLIVGGSEKGESYERLFDSLKNSKIKHVVITGATKYEMLKCALKVGYNKFTVTGDFEVAVKIASMVATEGENVLLSPACASFDIFKNYEERGERFISLVRSMS